MKLLKILGILLLCSTSSLGMDQEDIARDLPLNPFKGEVLWYEGETSLSIPGYKTPFKVPGDLEITLSPLAYIQDCLPVYHLFVNFCMEKIGPSPIEMLLNHSFFIETTAAIYQEALWLELNDLLVEIGDQGTQTFLKNLEANAYNKGVRHTFIELYDEEENEPFIKYLEKDGYRATGGAVTLEDGAYEQIFYKPMTALQEKDHPTLDTFSWTIGEDNYKHFFEDKFGLFVREKGIIRGGLFGTIVLDAATPYCYIDYICMDPTIKGTGLGKRIMDLTFKHVKERGAQVVELETTDYQAPWFYDKLGFTKMRTTPNCVTTLDGKSNNLYLYRKTL